MKTLGKLILVIACAALGCGLSDTPAGQVTGQPPVPTPEGDFATYLPLVTASAPLSGALIQSADLIYLGAFRLPDDFNWGALGLSFYPQGNGGAGTLLVTGFQQLYDPAHPGESCWDPNWDCGAYYGEIAIPTPERSVNWETLPMANFIRPMTRFDGGLAATVHREYLYVSDLEYVPRRGTQTDDKLYGAINFWYAEGVVGTPFPPSGSPTWTARARGACSTSGLRTTRCITGARWVRTSFRFPRGMRRSTWADAP